MMTHEKPFLRVVPSICCRLALLLLLAVVASPACTVKGAQNFSYLTEQRFPPKASSAPVVILDGQPDRPYLLIGEVSALSDVKLLTISDSQDAINKIKAMARAMGGDAIINYRSHRASTGTVGQGGFTAQGTVVRWK